MFVNKVDEILTHEGDVELWDFSKANISEESRINAITHIASICYQNPKALNSDSLYNRLMAESIGLPSSSFELCPILIKKNDLLNLTSRLEELNMVKYGEWVKEGGVQYLITNYRAVLYDKETSNDTINLTKHFNTLEECEIISKHFTVMKFNVDSNTRTQMIRHRVMWQELSRRYVSGDKTPFEFYISEKMSGVVSRYIHTNKDGHTQALDFTTEDIHNICLNHYNIARENYSIKPEEARRIIPQSMKSILWCGMYNRSLENFLKLRTSTKSQKEIRTVAINVNELLFRNNKFNIKIA